MTRISRMNTNSKTRGADMLAEIERIQKVVSAHFGKDIAVMRGTVRTADAAWARHIAMFLAIELTGATLQVVAKAFGKRDHGTSRHALRAVKDRCDVYPEDLATVRFLRGQVEDAFTKEAA